MQLTTHQLGVRYGQRMAFRDLNLEFTPGSVTAIVGPSGSGKSSLLQCLNRLIELIPEAAILGSVHLEREDIFGQGRNVIDLRKQVGMIFQKPNPFPVSIYKNLSIPLIEHGTAKAQLPEKVEKYLIQVGLWEEVKNRLHESALKLSGGQQQRLCIARALTLQPKILLMDEPCSSLDPLSTATIEELIHQLKKQITVIIVTHNLAQAKRVSDQLIVLWLDHESGFLLEQGKTADLFARPQKELTASYFQGLKG